MRKVILGLSFSIALILVGDFYRPVSNLVIALIAADIKARKPTLLTQPSPFEDLSELEVLAESENVMLFADINTQAPQYYLVVPKQRVYSKPGCYDRDDGFSQRLCKARGHCGRRF